MGRPPYSPSFTFTLNLQKKQTKTNYCFHSDSCGRCVTLSFGLIITYLNKTPIKFHQHHKAAGLIWLWSSRSSHHNYASSLFSLPPPITHPTLMVALIHFRSTSLLLVLLFIAVRCERIAFHFHYHPYTVYLSGLCVCHLLSQSRINPLQIKPGNHVLRCKTFYIWCVRWL